MDSFPAIMDALSQWMIQVVILAIIVYGAIKRTPMYESFVTGAKEGFQVAVTIIPYLVAMLFAIKVFMASGLFEDIRTAGVWAMNSVGLAAYAETLDLLPLALTRPLTGSGSRALVVDLYDQHGPDSFLGNTATLLMGSTETTFYVLAVYFGAVQIKKIRHAIPACLLGDIAGMIASVVLGYLLYGGR